QEGVAWFSAQGVPPRDFAINVTNGFGASYAVTAPTPLQPGGRIALPVTLKNDGLATWSAAGANPLHLAAHVFDATGQAIVWDGERTTLPATPISRAAPSVSVTVTNSSITTWSNSGPNTVDLSSHWLAADGTVLAWDGPRAPLGATVIPGASVTVTLPLAPPPPGAAAL